MMEIAYDSIGYNQIEGMSGEGEQQARKGEQEKFSFYQIGKQGEMLRPYLRQPVARIQNQNVLGFQEERVLANGHGNNPTI